MLTLKEQFKLFILVILLYTVIISSLPDNKSPPVEYTQIMATTIQTTTTQPVETRTYIGKFEITHYWPWVTGTNKTASGKTATDGIDKWVACNSADFPLGTKLYIEGYGYRIVEDRGVDEGHIDILVIDEETAFKLGRLKDDDARKVWVIK